MTAILSRPQCVINTCEAILHPTLVQYIQGTRVWYTVPTDVLEVRHTHFSYFTGLFYNSNYVLLAVQTASYKMTVDIWWRDQMETFSALLALCVGNSPVTGEFPAQRPMTRSFDVLFDLRLNKRLSKQAKRRWFYTPSRSLWRHCNDLTVLQNSTPLPWFPYWRSPNWFRIFLSTALQSMDCYMHPRYWSEFYRSSRHWADM